MFYYMPADFPQCPLGLIAQTHIWLYMAGKSFLFDFAAFLHTQLSWPTKTAPQEWVRSYLVLGFVQEAASNSKLV
jgi:hypothetical protein